MPPLQPCSKLLEAIDCLLSTFSSHCQLVYEVVNRSAIDKVEKLVGQAARLADDGTREDVSGVASREHLLLPSFLHRGR